MKTKTLLKSRRGISPILATLLLIVIAVAAIVVTYAWIMTYTSSAGRQAGVILRKEADCLWKTGNITIYVKNIGTSDAEIDKVFINSEPQDFTCIPSKTVARDGGSVSIVVNYQWVPDTNYHFEISPKVGETLSFYEKSPSS
ncbi:MAG: archaellin/type IV pilin N-terminal domain-containing protein [Candidatus Bathyarchaeia archaeon]